MKIMLLKRAMLRSLRRRVLGNGMPGDDNTEEEEISDKRHAADAR